MFEIYTTDPIYICQWYKGQKPRRNYEIEKRYFNPNFRRPHTNYLSGNPRMDLPKSKTFSQKNQRLKHFFLRNRYWHSFWGSISLNCANLSDKYDTARLSDIISQKEFSLPEVSFDPYKFGS